LLVIVLKICKMHGTHSVKRGYNVSMKHSIQTVSSENFHILVYSCSENSIVLA